MRLPMACGRCGHHGLVGGTAKRVVRASSRDSIKAEWRCRHDAGLSVPQSDNANTAKHRTVCMPRITHLDPKGPSRATARYRREASGSPHERAGTSPSASPKAAVAAGRPASEHLARWSDAGQRARAIAALPPFKNWPEEALLRLAQSARITRHRRGERILSRGDRLDAVYLAVEGKVNVGLSAATGRNVVFTIHSPGEVIHGVAPLVDGLEMANDVEAEEPLVVLAIPFAAVRAELMRAPVLWESLAQELSTRARRFVDEVRIFVLEPLRPRMAGLLLALAASTEAQRRTGPVVIDLRLPQDRLGDMLGVSRQTATALVREMASDGLLHWRYGRVTLLDLARLRALAADAVSARF